MYTPLGITCGSTSDAKNNSGRGDSAIDVTFADFAAGLPAVENGHETVEENNLISSFAGQLDGLGAILSDVYGVLVARQHGL